MNRKISHIRVTIEKMILWWIALIAILSISLPNGPFK